MNILKNSSKDIEQMEMIVKSDHILVPIPLTTHTGKIRVKERDNIYGYGNPVATRKSEFSQRHYIEWQIGFDSIEPNPRVPITFVNYKGERKYLFELSEVLYHLAKRGLVAKHDIKRTSSQVAQIWRKNLIERHPDCKILRTNATVEQINGLNFEMLRVSYPQLIYKFGVYEIIAEITIKEKQRAVGIQPMLYICFPVTLLVDENANPLDLLGRSANPKEVAYFKIDSSNQDMVLKSFEIFGMLTEAHQTDVVNILEAILAHI